MQLVFFVFFPLDRPPPKGGVLRLANKWRNENYSFPMSRFHRLAVWGICFISSPRLLLPKSCLLVIYVSNTVYLFCYLLHIACVTLSQACPSIIILKFSLQILVLPNRTRKWCRRRGSTHSINHLYHPLRHAIEL